MVQSSGGAVMRSSIGAVFELVQALKAGGTPDECQDSTRAVLEQCQKHVNDR